ncbi:MAG: hypothetical protein KIS92_10215 [Planctomycetota bacterium]|nr:hypothetical protein [Planctomycetota bacterium]
MGGLPVIVISYHRGEDMFGRIHPHQGLGYIATEFFHISCIPLFPQGSYVILEETNQFPWARYPIHVRWTSLFLAWLRAGCLAIPISYALYCFSFWLESSEGFPDAQPEPSRLPYLAIVALGSLLVFAWLLSTPRPDIDQLKQAVEEASIPDDRKQVVLRTIEEFRRQNA